MFVAHFQDYPASAHIYRAHLDAHKAYIKANRGKIRTSGSLYTDDLGNPIGALWYIQVKDRLEAEQLCHGDPFFLAGLRKGVTLVPLPDGSGSKYQNVRVACL